MTINTIIGSEHREPEYPVDPIFLNRWSPRAMSGDPMDDSELMPLFEAAKWAPSSYNGQPWRFLYAKRNTPYWKTYFDLLMEPNQVWAEQAAVLVVVISRTTFEHNGKPAKTHAFDTGSAWENLALQACKSGLVVHGMQGFDYERAKAALEVPDEYEVQAMIAIGKPGAKEALPEKLQEREAPSPRKPLSEIVMEGEFRGE